MTETTTGTKREGAAESSLLRMLAVIELFSIDKPHWTVEQVARALNLTHSTAYRYVAALCSCGYLAPLGGAEYSLGPKIIELDLIIRETDPIVARAETHAVQLIDLVPRGVVSLVSLRGDTAISVYQLKKPADLEISMERGRSMSIFAGSAAKIILAYLPRSRLLKLFGNSPAEIGRRGLGNSWREFSKTLLKIRRDATLLTIGEVNPKSWGISAPIFNADGDVSSSINLIMPSDTYESADREMLKAEVARAARSISAQVAPLEKIAGRAGKPKPQPQRTQK